MQRILQFHLELLLPTMVHNLDLVVLILQLLQFIILDFKAQHLMLIQKQLLIQKFTILLVLLLRQHLQFYKNGSGTGGYSEVYAGYSSRNNNLVSIKSLDLSAGDYVEIYGTVN